MDDDKNPVPVGVSGEVRAEKVIREFSYVLHCLIPGWDSITAED